jgi:tetratricopeptide (TPR) repeat protein
MANFPNSMMHQAGIRRWFLAAVLFSGVGFLFRGLPVLAQQTKPVTSIESEPAALLKEADEQLWKGSFDQAIAQYNQILKSGTKTAEAYTGIVRCYLKQEKLRDADETLVKGLQAKPTDPGLKVVQAELLFRQGRIPDAERIFVPLINAGGAPARAYLGLARISSATGLYAREYRLILRAHDVDPNDPDVQKAWMGTLSRRDRAKFLESYLAGPHGDDADTERGLREYLETLKARLGMPAACRLVSDVTATETELLPLLTDAKHIHRMGLPVVINGQKSKLMLDTGAGGITINRRLAARAGVRRLASISIGGVGDKGDAKGYSAYADSIRIGNLEFRNCPLQVVDKGSVGDEEGLIGADVFQQFLIELDFPKRKLNLSQLSARPGEPPVKPSLAMDDDEPGSASDPKVVDNDAQGASPAPAPKYFDRFIGPEMKGYAGVLRFGHMLLLPTNINEVKGKLFLIDSGAFDNVITPDAAREVTKVQGMSEMTVKGLSGEVDKVYDTGAVVLEFGGRRQKMTAMAAFDLSNISRSAGTEVSGILGFPTLNVLNLKINYRDALVKFEYVPSPLMQYRRIDGTRSIEASRLPFARNLKR